jgi:hypothetical protein
MVGADRVDGQRGRTLGEKIVARAGDLETLGAQGVCQIAGTDGQLPQVPGASLLQERRERSRHPWRAVIGFVALARRIALAHGVGSGRDIP